MTVFSVWPPLPSTMAAALVRYMSIFDNFLMPKKVFDPNKMINSGSSNIELRISFW